MYDKGDTLEYINRIVTASFGGLNVDTHPSRKRLAVL